jgi:hypothetical protein
MPALVVPIAARPSSASTIALPASQAFGIIKPLGDRCSALKVSAFRHWLFVITLTQFRDRCGRLWLYLRHSSNS